MNPINEVVQYLIQQNKLKVAEDVLDVFYSSAFSLQEFDLLGKLYHDIKSYHKALKALDKCTQLAQPEQLFSISCNKIKLYNHINRPDLALSEINTHLEQKPDDFDMNMEKAFALFLLNQKQESEAIFRDLATKALNPIQEAKVKFNLGTYDLIKNKFQDGLKGFLLEGKKIGLWKSLQAIPTYKLISKPFSNSKPKKLYVIAEGGYGDEFINLRFLKHLKELDIDATWCTSRKDIQTIIESKGYKALLNPDYNTLIDFDSMFCYSMSLPIWLETKENELWDGPYLTQTNPKFDFMKNDRFKIGLKWSGNPLYEHDLHRSIDINTVYGIVENFDLYNLQLEITEEEKLKFPNLKILELNDYTDTLSAISNLDLVITSCTSIAHASAGSGIRTIVMVPISAYYTWDTLRKDGSSWWYGENVTILFQTEFDNWNEPITKLKEIVNKL